jgi:predicted GNAT family acetyltransferase
MRNARLAAGVLLCRATAMNYSVRNNPSQSRYEMDVDGGMALALYQSAPGKVLIYHTEVPRHLRGRGCGAKLMRGVLAELRANNLKLVPRCSYVARFMREHPEFHALLG